LNGDAGINLGMYNRGLMRHYLDWLWGINLSRALMISLKNSSGKYSTLSTGRVQGPTLAFVAKRQLEINTFVPIPRFLFLVKIENQREIEVKYSDQFISSFDEVNLAVKNVKNKSANVKNIEKLKRGRPKENLPSHLIYLRYKAKRINITKYPLQEL